MYLYHYYDKEIGPFRNLSDKGRDYKADSTALTAQMSFYWSWRNRK